MPFLGLFWVNSWVSCLLGYSQDLFRVTDYITSSLPAKVLSVVGSPLESFNPLVIQASGDDLPQTNHSSVVRGYEPFLGTLPKLGFQSGGGLNLSPSNQAKLAYPSVSWQEGLENKLCGPVPKEKNESQPVTPILPSLSESRPEESGRVVSNPSLPQKILHMMQNLLHWPQRHESNSLKPKPVVVVRMGDDDEVITPPVSDGLTARRGFWLYSLMRPGRNAVSRSTTEQWPQILVNGHLIARVPSLVQANSIAESLDKIFANPNLDVSQLQPTLVNGVIPGGKFGDQVWFVIEEAIAKKLKHNPQLLAIEWVNNLRTALGIVPLTLVQAQSHMYGLAETENTFEGYASWYGNYFHGRPTATGEKFNQFALTAAHPSLPFDTYLKVTNRTNGDAVIVRVNDRGPYIPPRTLDLSLIAARCIKSEHTGVVPYSAVVMQPFATP